HRLSHDGEGVFIREPIFKRQGALVNQKAQTVVGFAADLAGAGQERGFCRFVDRIVGAVMR
ncbi:MAG: hypothetical protein ACK55Z_02460, partial [bacterium]